MTDVGAFKALSLVTTVGVLVVAACAIQLRGGEDTSAPPKAEQTTDVDDLAPLPHASLRRIRQVISIARRFGLKTGVASLAGKTVLPGLAVPIQPLA